MKDDIKNGYINRNYQLTLITMLTPRSEKQISVKVFMKGISPYLYKHFKNGLTSEFHLISVNIFERQQHLTTVKEFSVTLRTRIKQEIDMHYSNSIS